MRTIATMVLAFAMVVTLHIYALAAPKEINDPAKFSEDLVQLIAKNDSSSAAKVIAEIIGQPASIETLQNALQIFDGKKFNFTKQVIDRQFSGALRQIIHYAYVENLGFVYFRFNFKMTSTGWVMAHFTFKSETQELFPKDFVNQ